MIAVLGWIGAAVMVAASFNMHKPLGLKMALVGLSLLTVQAYDNETYNLIVLNLSSIIGFSLSLIRKKIMNFIFDLDHTVIDSSHRQLTRPDGSLDLDAWRENCTAEMIGAIHCYHWRALCVRRMSMGHNVIICTARVLSRHDLTYLADNDLRYHVLLSRDEVTIHPMRS